MIALTVDALVMGGAGIALAVEMLLTGWRGFALTVDALVMGGAGIALAVETLLIGGAA